MGEVKKEGYPENPYNRMEQGKFSPVLIAANQVTLKEIVDSHSRRTPITSRDKDHREPGKGIPRKMGSTLLEV
jgi:hypothetical protein